MNGCINPTVVGIFFQKLGVKPVWSIILFLYYSLHLINIRPCG